MKEWLLVPSLFRLNNLVEQPRLYWKREHSATTSRGDISHSALVDTAAVLKFIYSFRSVLLSVRNVQPWSVWLVAFPTIALLTYYYHRSWLIQPFVYFNIFLLLFLWVIGWQKHNQLVCALCWAYSVIEQKLVYSVVEVSQVCIFRVWMISTTPRWRWSHSDVYILNFEHIWHLVLVFLLLTLSW